MTLTKVENFEIKRDMVGEVFQSVLDQCDYIEILHIVEQGTNSDYYILDIYKHNDAMFVQSGDLYQNDVYKGEHAVSELYKASSNHSHSEAKKELIAKAVNWCFANQ